MHSVWPKLLDAFPCAGAAVFVHDCQVAAATLRVCGNVTDEALVVASAYQEELLR
eukprot:COSAG06_NODE_3365_length_5449_cov_2.510280_2_plen_55_part_00